MITEIETAVLTQITSAFTSISGGKIQKDARGLLVNPSVAVAIVDGNVRKVTQATYKIEGNVSILLTFKDLRGEPSRRSGIYPLVEGIFGLLLLKDLGLAIDKLIPEKFSEVTTDADYTSGEIKYLLQFRTGWNITEQSDEVVTDLIRVGLSYYLKPGDDTADTTDTVILAQ